MCTICYIIGMRILSKLLVDALFLAGFSSITYGFYCFYEPFGYISGGLIVVLSVWKINGGKKE